MNSSDGRMGGDLLTVVKVMAIIALVIVLFAAMIVRFELQTVHILFVVSLLWGLFTTLALVVGWFVRRRNQWP